MKTTEHTEKHRGFTEQSDPLTGKVISCAIEVHRQLGPGLLESTYEKCLTYELSQTNLPFDVQVPMPVYYKRVDIECGYKIDILVDHFLVVELKAVEKVSNLHRAQILTYMKVAEAPVGLLINFNVTLLKNGVQRFAM